MKNHDVFFEIGGKKMRTRVLADNAEQAKQKVIDKLIFHRVEVPKDEPFNQCMDVMEKFMDLMDSIGTKDSTKR